MDAIFARKKIGVYKKRIMKVRVVEGNLLDATEDYICHQCNCITNQSKYIAQQIFDKYPYSNTYKLRTQDKKTHSIPGTIDIKGDGKKERYVINMYSQYYPSYAKYTNDSKALRLKWFQKCLSLIGEEKNITTSPTSIAMPYKIGCGSAGGNWDDYLAALNEFATTYDIAVTLYKLS
jgi:O-acetyl-ADP-ribose deacetylase (regulator of RNase III)